MEQSGPPLKKFCTGRGCQPWVEYKEFSLPLKYPGKIDRGARIVQNLKKIAIINPNGNKINLGAKGISKLRIRDKDGIDYGEVNATFLNVNKLNRNQLINKQLTVDKKPTTLTLSTPSGVYGMLVPVEKQSVQQGSIVAQINLKPTSPKSTEKPGEISKRNKSGELVGNKPLEDLKKDLVKNASPKINRIDKNIPICTNRSLGVVKQKIKYFDIPQKVACNDKTMKQKETERKRLVVTIKANSVTHNIPDISEINTPKYVIKSVNEKRKEFSDEEKKLTKESTSPRPVILKGANPGKPPAPGKLVCLVKFNKLPTTMGKHGSKLSDIKLPTLKLNQINMDQLLVLTKTLKESVKKDSDTGNKKIEPNQDLHNNSNNNNNSTGEVDSISHLVPTVSRREELPEKNSKEETGVEDDVVILYDKRVESAPLENTVNDANSNISNQSQDINDQHVNSNEVNTTIEKSEPENSEKQITRTNIPLKDDENIRNVALSALAKCGTDKIQQITNNYVEVPRHKEIQTQTDVFGILDEKCFISINEPAGDLKRIKQIEFNQMVKSPVVHEVEVQTEPPQEEIQQQPKPTNYAFGNIDLMSAWNLSLAPELEEVHDFFKSDFKGNAEVNKVKKVLSIPQTFCKRVAMQLEKDYEEMQSWNEDGHLNIHRAVIDDDFRRVKRLLLIMKASKTNIDIRTEDGLTSLELAIKYYSSQSIVKLLLEAGAKPITSELLHDSAVILASRLSSPLLPLLLDYVTENELLNQVDSTGSAPLHYCAMNGNIDGLNALISKGVDVNLRDQRSGRTAFFHAVEKNHMRIAQRLIQSGGIADIPNFSGQSVMSLVDERNGLSLMPVLRDVIFQLPARLGNSNFL